MQADGICQSYWCSEELIVSVQCLHTYHTLTHAHTHARTHARMCAYTHTHHTCMYTITCTISSLLLLPTRLFPILHFSTVMHLTSYLQPSLTFVAMATRHTYCSVTIGMTPRTTVMTTTRLEYNAVSDEQQSNRGSDFVHLH